VSTLNQWLRALGRPFFERRRSPRCAFTESIEVRTKSGTIFRGFARDLSTTGMGALVCAELQVEDEVIVKYLHPKPPTMRQLVARTGRVRSRFGQRYGFEFDHAMECLVTNGGAAPRPLT